MATISKRSVFRQCLLNSGSLYTVLWVPDKKAKIGNEIEVVYRGKVENGWTILETWAKKIVNDDGTGVYQYGGTV